MPWATLDELLAVTSAQTLAEAVGDQCVTGELLVRAAAEDWVDLSDPTAVPGEPGDPASDPLDADLVRDTVTALTRVTAELGAAEVIIADGLGSHRPAADDTTHADILRVRTLDVALYRIAQPDDTSDATSPITRGYRAALEWLASVRRDGWPDDTLELIDASRRRFTAETLADFAPNSPALN